MLIVPALALLCAVGRAYAQDPNCDFEQNVEVGQTYYEYSPNYPQNYTPGVQCRWIGICPTGYNCVLNCSDVALPRSDGCSGDRLLISRTGDPQLTSAEYYCGNGTDTGTVTATSTAQRISTGLITSRTDSPGGRFMCRLYAQPEATTPPPQNCSCGYKRQNRIIGGQETGINEFPMMAALVDINTYEIKCGGVIISNRYVLTTAQCARKLNLKNLAIVVGEHDVNTRDSPATQVSRVISAVVHPEYLSTNYDYDIAILTTATDIIFSDRVGPVCLPFKFQNTDFTGSTLTILGWGTLFDGGPRSDVLRKVDVDVISQNTCQAREPSLTPRQICTYTPGRDACQSDSGGPLLYTDPATGLLFDIGIVSFGRFCANRGYPGVNTRVPALLDWIVANTPGANYCRK